jgi:hypothetical protein
MEKVLLILGLAFCYNFTDAQICDSTNTQSVNFELAVKMATYLSPHFSHRFSSHEIELGILFRHSEGDSPGKFKFSGFNLGYFYYPNRFGKTYDFYFFIDNKFEKCKTNEIWHNKNVIESRDEINAIIYQLTFGYGFKKIFLKRFYVATDVGFGRVYQKSYTNYNNINNPTDWRIDFQVRIKLGFYLK